MKKYRPGSGPLTVDSGCDLHSSTFSGRTCARFRNGRPVRMNGPGFFNRALVEKDFWGFIQDDPGSIHIGMDDGTVIFEGNLENAKVLVEFAGGEA